MRKQNLPIQKLMTQDALSEVSAQLRYDDVSGLYAAVGEGHVSTQSVIEKILATFDSGTDADDQEIIYQGRSPVREAASNSSVLVRGAPDILVKLAKCCTPVPNDEIVGFVTRGSGVSVHQTGCVNVQSLKQNPDRMIEVSWAENTSNVFLVQIQVEALDRAGLLSDVTRVLSDHHVNILSATVTTSSDRLALSRFLFETSDATHLDRVLNAVRRIDQVYDVYRVSAS